MKIQLTRVDQVTAALLQHFDGLCPRAADLLDNQINVLRVNTGLVHGSIIFRSLKFGDVIVVLGLLLLSLQSGRTGS